MQKIFEKLSKNIHIYGLLTIIILFVIKDLFKSDRHNSFISKLNFIIIISFLVHTTTTFIANYFRYEAYLVFLGILGISLNISSYNEDIKYAFAKLPKVKYYFTAILVIIITFPFIYRGVGGLMSVEPSCKNIHDQQCQMAAFINKYYPTGTVTINDIGAISFYTEAHVIDLIGLADLEVQQLYKAHKYNYLVVDSISQRRHSDIAIIYDKWFDNPDFGGIPPSWVKCGSWMVGFERVLGSAKVTFYAADSLKARTLISNLNSYNKSSLPKDLAYTVY